MNTKRWLRWFALAALALWAASYGLTRWVGSARMRRTLTARLEAAFGRPVEVARYEVSLWGGPRVEAQRVSVAEDPRFGQEYFLRAERLSAGLRWRALLRGRLEFGVLSFTRPSLNLVRLPDGRWNLENWLPPLPAGPAGAPSAAAPRFLRIQVDTGRINFKRGVDKHPFALVNVTGSVEQESAGRWRIDLEAGLMRAGVVVQEPGTLRIRGRVGGTSARLHPAELRLTWQDGSLADALRLARGQDYGVRGRLSFELEAISRSTADAGSFWSFAATARLMDVHRWDLPPRPTDPDLNLAVEGDWLPAHARVDFRKAVLEGPHSNVRANGFFRWAPEPSWSRAAGAAMDSRLRIISSGIGLDDLLAWYRAFRPGVAEGIACEGNLGADLEISGWPPRVEQGVLVANGARWRIPGLIPPVTAGKLVLRFQHDKLELSPLVLMVPRSELRLAASASRTRPPAAGGGPSWKFALRLSGEVSRLEQLQATTTALAWPVLAGWTVEGGARLDLLWQGELFPLRAEPQGTIELHNVRLRSALLNLPLSVSTARFELRPNERRLRVDQAEAFGARWNGWMLRKGADEPWEFSLRADRLDVAEVDRWLNPYWRQSLLERLMPKAVEKVLPRREDQAEREQVIERLRGRGRLNVDQLMVGRLLVRRLAADAQVSGRSLRVSNARADFYGGVAGGELSAQFSAEPEYGARAELERVNVAALAGASPALAGLFSGAASGQMTLMTRGTSRERLLGNLQGGGQLEFRDAQMHRLDLVESLRIGAARTGMSNFRFAAAQFALAAGKIQMERLRLAGTDAEFEATGRVDFARTLDLRLQVMGGTVSESRAAPKGSGRLGETFQLTGPWTSPKIARLASPAPLR